MKQTLLLLLFFGVGFQTVRASVEVRICGPNELNALDLNSNIMVGQELTLIVSCDPNNYWSGAFFIEGNDRALGTLSARDSDPNLRDFTDAHLPAAGDFAEVRGWRDSDVWGFDMYSSDSNNVAGDWFIIDYKAEKAGTCNIDFYDYNSSWSNPNITFTLMQDPNCDFSGDGIVNLIDFNKLSYYWLANCNDCADVNDCLTVDLDFDGTIDANDLTIFARHWLWDGNIKVPKNIPIHTPDPNLTYSVVDADGLDEIYLNVGESVRLYVDLENIDHNDLISFNIEVHISDPNYGSIVNTIDPNAPAPNDIPKMLANPRYSSFDIIGPGTEQTEGIHISAIHLALDPNYPCINDGHLASFVYTATDRNDIELSIVNISSQRTGVGTAYPTVRPILIHQTDPLQMPGEESTAMMSVPMLMSVETEPLPEPSLSMDKTIQFLEMIYSQDESFQNSIDDAEWLGLINSIKQLNELSK